MHPEIFNGPKPTQVTSDASVDGWGLFDVSMCPSGLNYIGDFIGQFPCVYLHNAV